LHSGQITAVRNDAELGYHDGPEAPEEYVEEFRQQISQTIKVVPGAMTRVVAPDSKLVNI